MTSQRRKILAGSLIAVAVAIWAGVAIVAGQWREWLVGMTIGLLITALVAGGVFLWFGGDDRG